MKHFCFEIVRTKGWPDGYSIDDEFYRRSPGAFFDHIMELAGIQNVRELDKIKFTISLLSEKEET